MQLKVGNGYDIAIALNRVKDLEKNISEPYMVCRQNILDLFANILRTNTNIYVGCTVTRDNCPNGVDFKILLACDGIESKFTMSVYNMDKASTIINYVPRVKDYDNILKSLYEFNDNQRLRLNSNYLGFSKSLKELLSDQGFNESFYKSFNIDLVKFKVCINENNELDKFQIKYLESLYKVEMFRVYAIRYNKTINLENIEKEYRLIADNTETIYIIIFNKGEYINREYEELNNSSSQGILNMSIKDC